MNLKTINETLEEGKFLILYEEPIKVWYITQVLDDPKLNNLDLQKRHEDSLLVVIRPHQTMEGGTVLPVKHHTSRLLDSAELINVFHQVKGEAT